MMGGVFRPKSLIAGFLAATNQKYLSEQEGIHVCKENIWSQFGIDNVDTDYDTGSKVPMMPIMVKIRRISPVSYFLAVFIYKMAFTNNPE